MPTKKSPSKSPSKKQETDSNKKVPSKEENTTKEPTTTTDAPKVRNTRSADKDKKNPDNTSKDNGKQKIAVFNSKANNKNNNKKKGNTKKAKPPTTKTKATDSESNSSNESTTNQKNRSEDEKRLMEMFGNSVEKEILQLLLENNEGDFEKTLENLLEMGGTSINNKDPGDEKGNHHPVISYQNNWMGSR